jgi:hypothetical protein
MAMASWVRGERVALGITYMYREELCESRYGVPFDNASSVRYSEPMSVNEIWNHLGLLPERFNALTPREQDYAAMKWRTIAEAQRNHNMLSVFSDHLGSATRAGIDEMVTSAFFDSLSERGS